MGTQLTIEQLQAELKDKNPRVILKSALAHFKCIGIAFSGAEDIVLIDMAVKLDPEMEIFTLDTGRLHPETYRFLEKVMEHYNIQIDILYPDRKPLEALVKSKGLFSFYKDGHTECCNLRKIQPMRRKLQTLDAWITGQRKDQSEQTREDLPEVESDELFSTPEHALVKFNPLTNWTSQKIWDYIEAYKIPYNELHERGYRSIGCEPCTRPTLPNQPERQGRWWWEDSNKKECGLHGGNLKD